ncbi:MAG: fluoride efflux transporter CrcB [Vicinamibacterales bacterium]
MNWLAVGVGGAIGALVRHACTLWVSQRVSWGPFPAGIFLVNLAGCLAIGVLAGVLASSRVALDERVRVFLVVGLLGGFTTFSSFGLDTFTLLRGGQTGLALLNAVGQLVGGILAVWLGFALTTRL